MQLQDWAQRNFCCLERKQVVVSYVEARRPDSVQKAREGEERESEREREIEKESEKERKKVIQRESEILIEIFWEKEQKFEKSRYRLKTRFFLLV